MFEWIAENSALIELVATALLGILGVLFKFYFDAKGDLGAALAAMGEKLGDVALEAGAVIPPEVIEAAAGALWDSVLVKIKPVAMFFSRDKFLQMACDFYYGQFESKDVVGSALVQAGVPMK